MSYINITCNGRLSVVKVKFEDVEMYEEDNEIARKTDDLYDHFCTTCKYMELELKESPCNRCNEFDEWESDTHTCDDCEKYYFRFSWFNK